MGPTNLSYVLVKIPHGNVTCPHQRLPPQGVVSMISSSLFLLTPPEVITLCSLEVFDWRLLHIRVERLGTHQSFASGLGSYYLVEPATGPLLL